MLRTLAFHFEEGGWGMYPLVVCLAVLVVLAIERGIALYRSRPDPEQLIDALARALRTGNVAGALGACAANPSPVARIAAAALRESMESHDGIAAALDQQQSLERMPLDRRTGYLATIAQVSTLFGLMGTMTGMITPFCAPPSRDAASIAICIARGLSEAMNCTAGGLFVSLVAILVLGLFRARERALVAEHRWVAGATRNLLMTHRAELRLAGRRAPLERSTYRTAA